MKLMIGRVIKIFSDFYYVDTSIGIIEAKLRGVIKKRDDDVLTGDYVELDQIDTNSMQAFISEVKERKSILSRPKVANVTRIIIVSALKEPDLDFEQLNRYIALCEYHNTEPILCFNKEDITKTELLKNEINQIYETLGYKIIFTSALEKTGIYTLRHVLKGYTTVLCGSSGVGKSSLINALLNDSKLKTNPVSEKTKRGTHTTRHCELIHLDTNTYIVDTPGFSHLKFDFLLPSEIQKLFVEFNNKNGTCKYKNCLHTGETGCIFEDTVKNMNIQRYESYKKFILEAKEYEEKISNKSIKNEGNTKYNKNKIMTKISHKKRELTRKTAKQKLYKEEM